MEKRCHPVAIFYNLMRVIYLVVIPVLRGFFAALQGEGLAEWARGGWIDILIFLLMLAIAVLRWYFTTCYFDERSIRVTVRFPHVRSCELPWAHVVSLSVVEPFYLRPRGAALVRADTLGGHRRSADINVYLGRKWARQIEDVYTGAPQTAPDAQRYTPSRRSVLLQALLASDFLGGILFFAALVSQSGKLFGNSFSGSLFGRLEETARTLAFGVPPAAAAIGYVLLFGWAVGVVLLLLRYRGFSVAQSGGFLAVRGGAPTRRSYRVRVADIACIDMQQTLISVWLGLGRLSISAVGYGKGADDIACVIPTEKKATLHMQQQAFFPAFAPAEQPMLRPGKKERTRFLLVPSAAIALLAAAMAALGMLFPDWTAFVVFVGCMAMLPALGFWAVQRHDYRTGGLAARDGVLTLRYSKGFSLHTVVVPAEQIAMIRLRQSAFQQAKGGCDLLVYTVAEGRVRHRCRGLDRAQTARLLGISL